MFRGSADVIGFDDVCAFLKKLLRDFDKVVAHGVVNGHETALW